MKYDPGKPLMVQNDFTVLLESRHPDFAAVRSMLCRFADLVKSPDQLHIYRMTSLSLWNAAASGMKASAIADFLQENSKYDPSPKVLQEIETIMERYGLLRMSVDDGCLLLVSDKEEVIDQLCGFSSLDMYWKGRPNACAIEVRPLYRGVLKQVLLRLGYPVEDLAGYHHGEALAFRLKNQDVDSTSSFCLRDYQSEAVHSFYREGGSGGGSGVVVLPCGAGKTIVGIAAMSKLNCATLILTSNVTSVGQWKKEILDKTDLTEDRVGEYIGSRKQVLPVTIATYQILTHRKTKEDDFSHMKLFNERDWGLIIYDEVHLLPAPVFRVTADIQATRRLGLTATLIREDGREDEVFSLIGPKRFDMAWGELESQGWIAKAECAELRVEMPSTWLESYRHAEEKQRFRIAGENPAKLEVIRRLMETHHGEPTLIIGQYLNQLRSIAGNIGAPMICGELPFDEREELYEQFKQGKITTLVVSKVANFAVDLPDAKVAIQVSGSYGSRQEEAQRLGRILRAKAGDNRAFYYSLVSNDTKEQDFAMKRQLFLVEQGYNYRIEHIEADSERWKQGGTGI